MPNAHSQQVCELVLLQMQVYMLTAWQLAADTAKGEGIATDILTNILRMHIMVPCSPSHLSMEQTWNHYTLAHLGLQHWCRDVFLHHIITMDNVWAWTKTVIGERLTKETFCRKEIFQESCTINYTDCGKWWCHTLPCSPSEPSWQYTELLLHFRILGSHIVDY